MARRSTTLTPTRRWAAVDLVRGAAIIAMVVYHFCFDLALNGWLIADFNEDWRWLAFRAAILGSFLFIAGIGIALAVARGQTPGAFWRRIAVIAGAAGLVTAGSYAMFPQSFIYFGVLHAIALMSVLARFLLPLRRWLFALGFGILIAGNAFRSALFDQPLLRWIGMMTFKPRTEDYVPLFPWFGVLLIGAGCGIWLANSTQLQTRIASWSSPWRLSWMAWLGRHSLAVYLLHQPLLLGSMLAVNRIS